MVPQFVNDIAKIYCVGELFPDYIPYHEHMNIVIHEFNFLENHKDTQVHMISMKISL